jgi:hypothetical protein
VGFGGSVAEVGRRGVGERANRRGPCVSEERERRHRGWKARINEENVFCVIRQRRARAKRADKGNDSLRKMWAGVVKLGWLGQIPRGNSKENIFLNFKDF